MVHLECKHRSGWFQNQNLKPQHFLKTPKWMDSIKLRGEITMTDNKINTGSQRCFQMLAISSWQRWWGEIYMWREYFPNKLRSRTLRLGDVSGRLLYGGQGGLGSVGRTGASVRLLTSFICCAANIFTGEGAIILSLSPQELLCKWF